MTFFWVTFFADVFAKSMQGEDMTLEELAELIKNTSAPSKEALPYLKLARFGNVRTPAPASCLRTNANVLSISGVEVEHDAGHMPFTEACDRIEAADFKALIYSTTSHTQSDPHWRVLTPTSKELPPGDRLALVCGLNGVFSGELAPESAVLSQAFHFGGINGPPAEMYIVESERYIDEIDLSAIAQSFHTGQSAGQPGAAPDFDNMTDESALLAFIENAQHYWRPSKRLLTIWARAGVTEADAESNLANAFDAVDQNKRDKKWKKNRASLGRWAKDVYARVLKQKSPGFLKMLAAVEEHFQGAIRLNGFRGMIEVSDPFPPKAGNTVAGYRDLIEEDILEAIVFLLNLDLTQAKKIAVWDAVTLVAKQNEYHPVRDWLAALPQWNDTPRVDELFLQYFPGEVPQPVDDAERQEWDAIREKGDRPPDDKTIAYYRQVAICFMVGAVARVMNPGVKVDTLPAMVGGQGLGKSMGLRGLCPSPAWFTDDISTSLDRDAKEALSGKWLIEFAEFPHIRRENERVKSFISRQSDRYRKAYGRLNADHPRQCVFCATTNDLEFLDTTGNRRVWPIPLAGEIDVAAIERDRDQLWAEALHMYRQGVEWWLFPDIEAIAEEMQDAFVEPDEWDADLAVFIDKITKEHEEETEKSNGICPPFTLREALEFLGFACEPADAMLGKPRATKADQMRCARRLRRLGFRRDPHRRRSKGRERYWIPVQKLTR